MGILKATAVGLGLGLVTPTSSREGRELLASRRLGLNACVAKPVGFPSPRAATTKGAQRA